MTDIFHKARKRRWSDAARTLFDTFDLDRATVQDRETTIEFCWAVDASDKAAAACEGAGGCDAAIAYARFSAFLRSFIDRAEEPNEALNIDAEQTGGK